jgi:predicted SnoaL-like aldol condensation-catalyzing enzyme
MAEALRESLLRRWFDAGWNGNDPTIIPEIFTEDYLAEGGAQKTFGNIEGHEGLREYHTTFHKAVNNLNFNIITLHVCGDIVMVEYRITGVFRQPVKGHEEPGERLDITAVDVYRFNGDKIAARMVAYEQA